MKHTQSWLSILLFMLTPVFLSGQQLTPFVVSTSGGFYSTGEGMLSFTTGELAVTETYANAVNFLTQGFQQPWDLGTGTEQVPDFEFSYRVFPNPSDGMSYFLSQSREPLQYQLRITDLLGRKRIQLNFDQQTEYNTQEIDLSTYPAGMYIISLYVRHQETDAHNLFVIPLTIVK